MYTAEKLKNYDPAKFKPGYVAAKKNGIHGIFDRNSEALIYSRTPRKMHGLEHIEELLLKYGNFPLVGEVYIPNMDFEEASGKIRSHNKTPEAIFHVFNCIIPESLFKDRLNYFYLMRSKLKRFYHIEFADYCIVNTQEQFDNYYKVQTISFEEEGVCWISPDHIYQPGKRTWDWMKRVPLKSVEAKVIDILPGTKGKKYEHSMGRMLCQLTNSKEFKVGIFKGQTDEWRQMVWDKRWTYKGKKITVEFKNYSKYGIPVQPRFKSFRWDI